MASVPGVPSAAPGDSVAAVSNRDVAADRAAAANRRAAYNGDEPGRRALVALDIETAIGNDGRASISVGTRQRQISAACLSEASRTTDDAGQRQVCIGRATCRRRRGG